jgi:GlpG protein
MRQAGTIPDEQLARRLVDYLATQGIPGRVDQESGGWGVWVHDEDRLDAAKQLLQEFLQQPDDPRYQGVEQSARQLRQEEARRAARIRKNIVDVRQNWDRASQPRRCPLTFILVAASVLITAVASLQEPGGPVANLMYIAPVSYEGDYYRYQLGLDAIRQGQIWRLVTPIFLHARIFQGLGILHIVFNMFWTLSLGSMIESRRGTIRFLLLVLATAILSNLGQYWASGPLFGGMSGVVYGLFGFAWMKTRFDRGANIYIDQNTVSIMLVWFVLCLVGVIPHVANWAHGVGLVTGMAIGYLPHLVRKAK